MSSEKFKVGDRVLCREAFRENGGPEFGVEYIVHAVSECGYWLGFILPNLDLGDPNLEYSESLARKGAPFWGNIGFKIIKRYGSNYAKRNTNVTNRR